jgi:regulator of protease activity HflC (stomatin/prohibitin superfamily)
MNTQAPPVAVPKFPAQPVSEYQARSIPGLPVLGLGLVGVIVGVVLIVEHGQGTRAAVLGVVAVLILIASELCFHGLTPVQNGEARVIQLFGRYRGTIRSPGLQWVNPFTRRRRVSTRIRNLETSMVKVNDADGNPIEIAAVVVWLVEDTGKAIYAVDAFEKFVAIQAETAVRHIASSYAYEVGDQDRLSLRANADEITARLSTEIGLRVASAGVQIVESRLTRLSYASEIAQAMLRRQAASAVVGARQVIVQGAVGMVKLALTQLEEQGVVELDEERKAAMVSNLLVVLCSEQATQQVVNTGSLYQ